MAKQRTGRDHSAERELTPEELEQETGNELPQREAMSILSAPLGGGAELVPPLGEPLAAPTAGPVGPHATLPPVE